MNKNILAVAAIIVALSFTSCGNNSNSQNGTHTHDDGSVHEAHTVTPAVTTTQESFKADTVTRREIEAKEGTHTHSHDTGHSHDHDSEHKH